MTAACSDLIYEPSDTRDRIVGQLHGGTEGDGIHLLNACYAKVVELAPLMQRLRDARQTPQQAHDAGTLSDAELAQIEEMNALVSKVIAVDDYTPEELSAYFKGHSAETADDYTAVPKKAENERSRPTTCLSGRWGRHTVSEGARRARPLTPWISRCRRAVPCSPVRALTAPPLIS